MDCYLTSFFLEEITGPSAFPPRPVVLKKKKKTLAQPSRAVVVLSQYQTWCASQYVHEGLKCTLCGLVFSLKESFEFHRCFKHKCNICPESFLHVGELREHKRRHRGKYSCTECNREFTTMRGRASHMKVHRHGTAIHSCTKCGDRFRTRDRLREHSRRAHKSK